MNLEKMSYCDLIRNSNAERKMIISMLEQITAELLRFVPNEPGKNAIEPQEEAFSAIMKVLLCFSNVISAQGFDPIKIFNIQIEALKKANEVEPKNHKGAPVNIFEKIDFKKEEVQ